MKTKILFTALLLMISHFISSAQGTWTKKANFGGVPRWGAVGFSIAEKGYIGTGSSINPTTYYKDFWEYDPATNAWTQKADFGGDARDRAVGFSIGNKGYVGTGVNSSDVYLKDFWEYDPATNAWTGKADFGGSERYGAFAFSTDTKGYVGTGDTAASTHSKDFWEYDPATDKWTRKADFGGAARQYVAAFAVDGKGYAGTGYDGGPLSDFWEYNPLTNTWTQKTDFAGGPRYYAIAFAIEDKGYMGTGEYGPSSPLSNDFWQYDPATNKWKRKANVGDKHRGLAVGFSIGNKGYVGTGGGDYWQVLFKDFWEYTPGIACDDPTTLKVTNITDTSARLSWHGDTSVKVFCIVYRAINTSKWTEKTRKPTYDHIVLRGLSPNTTYQWKMRSICKDGYSKWVTGPDFTTASSFASTSTSDASIAGKFSASISPNPVTANLPTLRISNATANNYQLSIADMQGKVLINQNLLLNGSSNKTIDVSVLPKGIYILKIINNKNEQQQIKFVKAN